MMTDFWAKRFPDACSAARICGSDKPPMASPPIFKNDRRPMPSQKRPELPGMVSTPSS